MTDKETIQLFFSQPMLLEVRNPEEENRRAMLDGLVRHYENNKNSELPSWMSESMFNAIRIENRKANKKTFIKRILNFFKIK